MTKRPISVLLTTEGTYPFAGGGVSTWCHILVQGMPDIDWTIYAVTADPYGTDRYEAFQQENIQDILMTPLWGAEETAEYIDQGPFSRAYIKKRRTTRRVVEKKFIPLFLGLLRAMEEESSDLRPYGRTIHGIYKYFQKYDYRVTMRSEPVWRCYRDFYLQRFAALDLPDIAHPTLFDFTTTLRWLYNFMMPICRFVPETDIVHATIASSAALAGVVARYEYGTPFLVTDHGVYVRERYIAVSASEFSYFSKRFLINLGKFFSRISYCFADMISPCAHFNARWELPFGCVLDRPEPVDFDSWDNTGIVPDLNTFPHIQPTFDALVDHGNIGAYDETTQFPWIRTIYNGVDTDKFVPGEKPEELKPYKTGVALARVFPLKDLITMIKACDIVRREVPETRFIIYGSLKADPPYVAKCEKLIDELDLREHFRFAGFHSKPHQAVWEGDINLLSSISEGFPFTVLESMSCGVPNVATDVGGVKEAVGVGADACGVVVPPMNPQAFAEGCIKLFKDDRARVELGRRSRERVLRLFKEEKSVAQYREAYSQLAALKQRRRFVARRA